LNWTFVNAGTTVNAGVFVDLCFLNDFNRLDRAYWFTSGTAGTCCFIYFYDHSVNLVHPWREFSYLSFTVRLLRKIVFVNIEYMNFENPYFSIRFPPSIFLFWFILFHLLIRSFSTQSKIKIYEPKFKSKNDKKIQKSDKNCFRYKSIGKRYWSKERNEHTNQYQQKHLDEISFLPHEWESITTFLLKGISAFTNNFLEVLSSTIMFRTMAIPQSSQQLSFFLLKQVHSQYRWVHR